MIEEIEKSLNYNLGHKGWKKKSFYTHFAPPHPYAMLTKHFPLTQVCILPFSNTERGNGGVDTYFVDITIIISRFLAFSNTICPRLSSPVKMSQAFHNPSICFNVLYFHRKVSTFKTPESCLYLDSDVWARCFTIIFAGSFHYFKPVSCWILFCENVTGVPQPFDQLPSRMGKVNTFKTSEMQLYFDSDVWGECLTIIFVGSFFILSFLPKLTVKWDESNRLKIGQ